MRKSIGAVLLILMPGLALAAADIQPGLSSRGGMLGEPVTPVPKPRPASAAADLGKILFTSKMLSYGNVRSCASCHDLDSNGAERRKVSVSPSGQPLALNTPTVFNAALSFRQDWEGDVRTLQEQANESIQDKGFMNETWDDLLRKLRDDASLGVRFQSVFGRPPDRQGVLDAIAAFEATLLTPDSRFDLWLRGDSGALTPREQDGYRLFKSAGCVSCHQGVNFGGNLYEKAGVYKPLFKKPPRRMRVPSLRNVAVTAPYFDDGSAATLKDAVRRMAEAQLGRELTSEQIDSIADFLATLTGRYEGRPLREAP